MTTVVLMAGGRGLRLHPLTSHTPKPLLRVGSRPILETVMRRFMDQGFYNFVFSLNYLSDLIKKYFGDGRKWGCRIRYIVEAEELGTAGSLSMIPEDWLTDPFIVSNADILADINYQTMVERCIRVGADACVALGLHQQQIPYGVVACAGDFVTDIREKPIEGFSVLAGVYVLRPSVVDRSQIRRIEMPDLLGHLNKVAAYPIEGYWHDVGTFESMVIANQEVIE